MTIDLNDPESRVLAEHGAVIGEEAHIRSRRDDGPRHDESYPAGKLDSYENLVLLCPTHHAIVDKDGGVAWSVEELERMKEEHEAQVDREADSGDRHQRELDEQMAARVQVWEQMAGIDSWQALTSSLNSPIPRIRKDDLDRLIELGAWLLKKNWPEKYPRTASAFENHRRILTLLLRHLNMVTELDGPWVEVDRPFKRIPWNPKLYDELISEYGINCNMIWWMTVELTRSVNLVISALTEEFDPLYRFHDGVVLMHDGDGVLEVRLARLEYENVDWSKMPANLSLEGIREAIVEATGGGDPRGASEVDLYRLTVDQ